MFGILAVVSILAKVAKRRPDPWWVILLSRFQFGPRTDVRFMTRPGLFQASRMFLIYAIICLVVLVGLMRGLGRLGPEEPSPTYLATVYLFLFYLFMFSFLVCAVSSIVLFVRGVFRSKSYTPHDPEIDEDETEGA